ncbi:MAG TPA: AMP-binding protein, partial [bacterium]|nr:AMP-binding protein [bacterium]
GLLLVKGANRMVGYLNQPEKTSAVFQDGWYITGDIARIDEDGFIQITDRLSRFSKIGGEMVPHARIEEAINRVIPDADCVVTAVSDERKGERLVVLYTGNPLESPTLRNLLQKTDLPPLWIPKPDDFHCVPAIPMAATGKVDLRRVKAMATELSANTVGETES